MAPYSATARGIWLPTAPRARRCFVSSRAAVAELDGAIEWAQRRGWQVSFGWFSFLRGAAHQGCGELMEAMADLTRAADAYTPDARGVLALCLIERNDLAGAAEALTLADETARVQAASQCVSYVYALGRLRVARGELRWGLQTLLDCERLVEESHAPNPAARPN